MQYQDIKAGSSGELVKMLNALPEGAELVGQPFLGADKQVHALVLMPPPAPKKKAKAKAKK